MKKRHSELYQLKNIGLKSEAWLNAIGVHTKSDLVRLGSIHAYWLLKDAGFNVSLNLVYAMEGAILDTRWDELPEKLKAELRVAIDKERHT
jgi:TfoX/Sxy family transcriptional regulator of competence genes